MLARFRLSLCLLVFTALVLGYAPLTPSTVGAEPRVVANVVGTVWYDADGQGTRSSAAGIAVSGARVVIHGSGLPDIYTNDRGTFAVSLPAGTYTFEIWWDSVHLARESRDFGGAYTIARHELVAGQIHRLSFGVRPANSFPPAVDSSIQVVWPHDGEGNHAPVADAPLVNIRAYLFHAGTLYPVPCTYAPRVTLFRAFDDQPGRAVARGRKREMLVDGKRFPVWEFHDVDVSPAVIDDARVHFWLEVLDDTVPDRLSHASPRFRSNVWTHAASPLTYSTSPRVPRELGPLRDPMARIDMIWPQDRWGDEASIENAISVTVSVALLDQADPERSATLDLTPTVRLHKSINSEVAEVVVGERVLVAHDEMVYPMWVFEGIDISAARNPANRYSFRVSVDGWLATTSVWVYGFDDRTDLPQAVKPIASGAACW